MRSILPHTHGERVDVLVELIQESDGLDDHVVCPVDIKLDFGSGVAVTQTQLSFGCSLGGEPLDQRVKVQTDTCQSQTMH